MIADTACSSFLFRLVTPNCCLFSFFRWIASNRLSFFFFVGSHPTGCFFSFVGLHSTVIFFRWIASNCFVCYFWLDPKVTKRSRLNRTGYSGRRLRCRLRNSLRSNSAGSGRYAFTLRFTPVRLGLSQKAPLSLIIADTACFFFFFFLSFPFCIPLFVSLFLPFISLYLPFTSPNPVGAGLCSALPHKSPTPFRPST